MPIFFSLVIVFCIWLSYEIKKSDKLEAQYKKEFLEREHQANLTRKQSTDDLVRITMPEDIAFHPNLDALTSIENKLKDTLSHEIINLTGISNTELKLNYGRANLDYLAECDGYFTRLVNQLKQWVNLLYENDLHEDCIKVLDFAISIKADNSDFFVMRANYYVKEGNLDAISSLIEVASNLNGLGKDLIVDRLNSILVDNLT